MKRPNTLSLLMLAVSISTLSSHSAGQPDARRAVHHIRVLAHDSLEGREAGSVFADRAADYIEAQFRSAGLGPAGNPGIYRQRFSFLAGLRAGPRNALSASLSGTSTAYRAERDFRPMAMSASGDFEGEIVFAGFGIVAPGSNHDDYEGIDVSGKGVLVLSSYPDADNPHSTLAEHASAFVKVQKAKEKGALAVFFVRTTEEAPEDSIAPLSVKRDQGRSSLVVVHVTRAVANQWLSSGGLTVDSLASASRATKAGVGMIRSLRVKVQADIEEIFAFSDNVMGYLPGSDPRASEEYVIVGAHYDHLGRGGSGSLAPRSTEIHNGADDNASGTGALLELARSIAKGVSPVRRGVLFLAFTAEEIGLIGSAHYAKNPVLPLENAVAMLNMDMVGRMKDRTLVVFGMGTSPEFPQVVKDENTDNLALKLNNDGFGPSDHSSFYAQKIPVMHFFTDLHPQYHRPTDDADLIHADSLQPVLDIVERIMRRLADAASRPEYAVAPQTRPQGQARGFRVWVGTIPDYAEQTDGMRISGVSPESPAEKAGLQAGDVIVKFGSVEVKNVYDYTYALGQYKPGDNVDVVVRRGSEKKSFPLTLVSRNR